MSSRRGNVAARRTACGGYAEVAGERGRGGGSKPLDDDAVPGSLTTKNLSRFAARRLFEWLQTCETEDDGTVLGLARRADTAIAAHEDQIAAYEDKIWSHHSTV